MTPPIEYLLSVPPAAAGTLPALENIATPPYHVASDPPGPRLGSGGGSVHMLLSAWRNHQPELSFQQWLNTSRKLVIHGGGQSRRLPAYAATGKLFIPMPVWRWSRGQRIDQHLLDLHLPGLQHILEAAPDSCRCLIASGDVLVKFSRQLPPFPKDTDVICVGLWGKPENATNFGVFFCHRRNQEKLLFFRQKPSVDEIQEMAANHLFLLDAGIWLLSERAINALMRKGGRTAPKLSQPAAMVEITPFELYSDFGLGLGRRPTVKDPELNSLKTAVVAPDHGEFYHFGCTSDLVESSLRLQNLVLNQNIHQSTGIKLHPDLFVQNARIETQWTRENHRVWVENSHLGPDWKLSADHVVTGVPPNQWRLEMPPGSCIDLVPIQENSSKARLAVRCYHVKDTFRGQLGHSDTRWMGQPAKQWFEKRRIPLTKPHWQPGKDIHDTPVFPLLAPSEISGEFLEWMLGSNPDQHPECSETYRQAKKISAAELSRKADLTTLHRQRRKFLNDNLETIAANHRNSVFYRTDLNYMARLFAANQIPLPPTLKTQPAQPVNPLTLAHDRMFRAETRRRQNRREEAETLAGEAFQALQEAILAPALEMKSDPQCCILADQIVWSRSPVRLDLAGGWTDTPPFCQLNGGKVVNLAVNLNGQPPLQTFIRTCKERHVMLRSIDTGQAENVTTFDDLCADRMVGSVFAIAKAALALAGFHPRFCQHQFKSLKEQLENFGGGLEISFVAAVPKGSGLGTSSILATTILAALNDFCNLKWDVNQTCYRTLALEQMLTAGGGWQDQLGAVLHGVKLLETEADLLQAPRVKWLPEHMIEQGIEHGIFMLYYTGITRVAKNILREIVRNMFLNEKNVLNTLQDIKQHAEHTCETIQTADWDSLAAAVAQSWQLNQKLDRGTNPPPIQELLASVQDCIAGAKLLGAGGGGYLLILAKDTDAASRIQRTLRQHPPNDRARFVQPEISTQGIQTTRS